MENTIANIRILDVARLVHGYFIVVSLLINIEVYGEFFSGITPTKYVLCDSNPGSWLAVPGRFAPIPVRPHLLIVL